jgi:hypothetical protein
MVTSGAAGSGITAIGGNTPAATTRNIPKCNPKMAMSTAVRRDPPPE